MAFRVTVEDIKDNGFAALLSMTFVEAKTRWDVKLEIFEPTRSHVRWIQIKPFPKNFAIAEAMQKADDLLKLIRRGN